MNSYFSLIVIISGTFLYGCGTMNAPGAVSRSSTTPSNNISKSDRAQETKTPKESSVGNSTDKGQHARILAAIKTTEKTSESNLTKNSSSTERNSATTGSATTIIVSAQAEKKPEVVVATLGSTSERAVVSQQGTHSTKQTSVGSDQKSAGGSTQKPADGSNSKTADGSIPKSADGSIPKSADGSTQKSANGSTQKSANSGLNTSKGVRQATVANSKKKQAGVDVKSGEEHIRYSLANRYYQSGKYQSTIDILESSDSHDLKNIKNRDLLVLAYTSYAKELVSKADLLEAQTILEKALLMRPKNKVIQRQLAGVKNVREADIVFVKAVEAYKNRDLARAYQSFDQVLRLNPSHKKAKKYHAKVKTIVVDSYHKKALQYYRSQQLSQAIKEWNSLLKVDPGNDLARIYRSRAIELKKKFEKL